MVGSARALLRETFITENTQFLADLTRGEPRLKSQLAPVLAGAATLPRESAERPLPVNAIRAFEQRDAKGLLEGLKHHGQPPELPWIFGRLLERWIDHWLRLLLGSCPVQLDWILFNHAPGTAATSALNIRRNRLTPIALPEWQPSMTDPADAPAAYSLEDTRGQQVSIRIRLSAASGFTGTAQVRARGGGVLGPLDPFIAAFSAGSAIEVHVPLAHHTMSSVGRWDVTWEWEVSCADGLWWPLATTIHRVYIVLRTPQAPWQSTPLGLDQNPWTEALDVATQLWPGYQPDPVESVAEGLCGMLNPGGAAAQPFRVLYDVEDAGRQHYDGPGQTFNLSALLERARGGEGAGAQVNCDDCAGMVVSLANILGCDLWEQELVTQGMRPVMPLGYGRWWLGVVGFIESYGNFGSGLLLYHTVAWRGDDPASARVFDIAYLLNGYEDPDRPQQPDSDVRVIYYAHAVRFQEPGSLDYIEQLHPGGGWALGTRRRRSLW
jgi:hypothetical protein